jgi:hypothetical protein
MCAPTILSSDCIIASLHLESVKVLLVAFIKIETMTVLTSKSSGYSDVDSEFNFNFYDTAIDEPSDCGYYYVLLAPFFDANRTKY